MFEKLKPVGDRVLVKRVEEEATTTGGIIIPEAAKEKTQTGTVLAIGPGRVDQQGNRIALQVKKGDTVYFGKFAGTDLGDDHLILREDEILGVVEK